VDSIPTLAPRMAWSSEELTVVLEAIAERRSIKFSYTNKELIVEIRTVQPYAVASRGGHWYFTGMDTSKSELRTFRFDRVHGQIEVDATALAYEIPEGFDLLKNFEQDMRISTAVLEVRQGKAFELRKLATAVEQLGEWDRITCEYFDESSFIDLVLWHLDDAVVLEPQALRDSIISSLNEILDMHG
jgi:proteasome accessory factor B